MDTEHVDAESFLNELTKARWHLDRAAAAGTNAGDHDVATAREICEGLTRLLHEVVMDVTQRGRMQTELSELTGRLRAMESGARD